MLAKEECKNFAKDIQEERDKHHSSDPNSLVTDSNMVYMTKEMYATFLNKIDGLEQKVQTDSQQMIELKILVNQKLAPNVQPEVSLACIIYF